MTKRWFVALTLAATVLVAAPAGAQLVPITTQSEEARRQLEIGRALAFHWYSEAAHEHLDAAIAADSTLVLAYLHRAGTSPAAERQRYFDLAEAHRDRVSEGERGMIDAFRAFLLERDPVRAVRLFEELAAEYPDDPYLPGYIGIRHLGLRNYADATRYFRNALERDPGFVQAHNLLGQAALRKRDLAAAMRHFEEYRRLAPDQPYAHFSMGELYRATGRHDEAIAEFEAVLARHPRLNDVWIRPGWMRNYLGYIYLEAGRLGDAERAFGENARLHPEDPNVHGSLGELYLHQRRWDDAASSFERALAVDPRFSASRDNLARARIEQGNERFEEAFRRQDAAALASLYSPDGQLLPAGSGAVEGAEAIRGFWQEAFNAGLTGAELETLEVFTGADGETATEVGRYRLVAGEREADTGKYVVVWQRTPEGWQLHRDIWTSDGTSNR